MDRSRIKDNSSTGSAFYIDTLEMGFYVSVNKHCSSFTAEICTTSETLKWYRVSEVTENILVLTDSRSVVCALKNNKCLY